MKGKWNNWVLGGAVLALGVVGLLVNGLLGGVCILLALVTFVYLGKRVGTPSGGGGRQDEDVLVRAGAAVAVLAQVDVLSLGELDKARLRAVVSGNVPMFAAARDVLWGNGERELATRVDRLISEFGGQPQVQG